MGTIPPSIIYTGVYQWIISDAYSQAQILSDIGQDLKSSAVNTKSLLEYNLANVARLCNSETLIGQPCAVPNIQTAAFICTKSDLIDSTDPTSDIYPEKKISEQRIWTSSSNQINVANASSVYTVNCKTRQINVTSATQTFTAVPILEIPAYEDRTGERIDNKATIIGKLGENWIAVLDAAYRSSPIAFRTDTNSNYTDGIPNIYGTYNVGASWTENDILAKEMFDIHSAKWNTDYMNQRNLEGNPAAKFCYNQTISGKTAQLPNIQELALMWTKRSYIDANDPTVSDNMSRRAEAWATSSEFVWSSSGSNSYNNASVISGYGSAGGRNITAQAMVFPILEIPLYKDRTGERVDGKATIAGKLGNYWIAVLDAAYRAKNLKWGKYGTDLSGLTNISGSYTAEPGWEEAAILSQTCKDTRTSKQNTDYLKTVNTETDNQGTVGVPAAAHCFGQTILGTNAQLGNVQTGVFVWSHGSTIDAGDPTAAENPTKAMSAIGNYWTSSEFGLNTAYQVNSGGSANPPGKDYAYSACPVYEIPLWCDDDYK